MSDTLNDSLPQDPSLGTAQPDCRALHKNWHRGFRSALAATLLVLFGYLGSLFMHGPFLILLFINAKLFRTIMDTTLRSWMRLAEFTIVRIMGIRVRHFGDRLIYSLGDLQPKSSSLIIMNHRTELDWFFAWGLGESLLRTKIILKESLSKLPGVGWAMQNAGFIFLRRNFEVDKHRIELMMHYLSSTLGHFQLLLFPEGTNLCPETLQRSDAYAQKIGLPSLRYTLHPRLTGFLNIVRSLREADLTHIYDVTIAYPDHTPEPLWRTFFARFPHEVHFLVRRYSISELTDFSDPEADDKILSAWLTAKWAEKEQLLEEYYSNNPSGKRVFDAPELPVRSQMFTTHDQLTFLGWANTVFWAVWLPVLIYKVFVSSLVFGYTIFIQVFYFLATLYGGVHMIAAGWTVGHLHKG